MPLKNKKLIFDAYRFQLIPTSRSIQETFSPLKITSLNALIQKKNVILKRLLDECAILPSDKNDFTCRLESKHKEIYVFRVGFERHIQRTKRSFVKERLDDWPNILIIFNNDPDVQKILIEHSTRLVSNTLGIANRIGESLNTLLREYQLYVAIEPLFEEQVFWNLVREHWNKITVCDFELVTPNLANISGKLSEELKVLQKCTNSVKSHIKLESDKAAALNLSQDDRQLADLVDYASRGGGNIRLKIRGYNRYKSTLKNIKAVIIDEMEVEGLTLDQLKKLLPDLFT